jgi:cell division protein FtsW (lipid II flippase)
VREAVGCSHLPPRTSTLAQLRAETIPLIFGVLVGLMGVGLILDAQLPDYTVVKRERRRRKRIERSRGGEMLLGLAMLGFAAAMIGRDTWRYRIVAVIFGVVALILGTVANRAFIRDAIVNRGAMRRDPAHPIKPGMPEDETPARIR